MDNYKVFLPAYSVGKDVYNHIGEICELSGQKVVIIGGRKALSAAEGKIKAAIKNTKLEILDIIWYGENCTYNNVERLSNLNVVNKADMIFAVGGGKAMDTCKALGVKLNKDVYTFPTIASNCAACTTVSIMYNDDGTFKEPFFFQRPAKHAFINTEIINDAPYKYMWAGIGDTYAKYYEATVSARGLVLEHFTELGVGLSKMCCMPLMICGKKALEDNKKHVISKEFEKAVLTIIVTTAITSSFLTLDHTPDYNSGLAHAFFYSLTSIEKIEKEHLHGEVVSLGVLLLLLCDNEEEEFKKVYNFNKDVGLPVCLKDIDISMDEFMEVVGDIKNRSDVRKYPYKITDEMVLNAMEKLEVMANEK